MTKAVFVIMRITKIDDNSTAMAAQQSYSYKTQIQNKNKISISDEKNKMPLGSGTHLYKCDHCIYSTIDGGNLKVHMRRHNPEKLFKCNQCNYEGNQQTTLDSHI